VGGGNVRLRDCCRPNGSDVKLRGQGPRAEADAAHGVHACKSRDAAARRRVGLTSRGGSAAGPKPGRVGFYLELGGRMSSDDVSFLNVVERTTLAVRIDSLHLESTI